VEVQCTIAGHLATHLLTLQPGIQEVQAEPRCCRREVEGLVGLVFHLSILVFKIRRLLNKIEEAFNGLEIKIGTFRKNDNSLKNFALVVEKI